jgi:uncharacterized RDD family membrane protein YckC
MSFSANDTPLPSSSSDQDRFFSRDDGSAPNENVADRSTRFLALLIDGLVAAALSVVPLVGGVAGVAYYVVRDGLRLEFMNGRSIGKHVMGIDVVRLDGRAMDVETSVRRNWMWGIGALTGPLVYIPILGWMLIPLVALIGVGIGLYEAYRVLGDPEGRRWGDQMAGTLVVR